MLFKVFRKSKKSNSTGNCAEVNIDPDVRRVFFRNSRFPNMILPGFTYEEWDAFLDGAKKGEFDLPE